MIVNRRHADDLKKSINDYYGVETPTEETPTTEMPRDPFPTNPPNYGKEMEKAMKAVLISIWGVVCFIGFISDPSWGSFGAACGLFVAVLFAAHDQPEIRKTGWRW